MQEPTTSPTTMRQCRQDIEAPFRRHIREALDVALQEELAAALGSERHERPEERRGYRNGRVVRTITTPHGTRTVTVPRGRIVGRDGVTHEFHSQLLPRYARRAREVDEAIPSCDLAGTNRRRSRPALTPLLGERHLSKSAVSRIVARLKALLAGWRERDWSSERSPLVFLDSFHLKVRLARRVVSVPVLAALGMPENDQTGLLDLRVAVSEAEATWGGVITGLPHRGLVAPLLLVVDGHAGLKPVLARWEGVRVQRCTTHKLTNRTAHCPTPAQAEMTRDDPRISSAADGLAARAADDGFLKKWTALCPPVARSLEEAGLDLLTFYAVPKAMGKSLRTTNTLENLNREFRRRTKTQASFSTEDGALTVLDGLVAFGHIRLRKIDGHTQLPSFIAKDWQNVA
jgi:putative transposase